MKTLATLLATLILVSSSACWRTSTPPTSAATVATGDLECRIELTAGDPAATPFTYEERTVHLGPPVTFGLAHAYATTDAMGLPAVGFEIDPAERDAFRAYSAERVDEMLGVLVDGEVVTLARIVSPLPGTGVLAGGAGGWTAEEVDALVAALRK